MSVSLDDGVITLSGACRVEDAEPLLSFLQSGSQLGYGLVVDLTAMEDLHAAVLQVLLAFNPRTRGIPADAFLKKWLVPLFERSMG